MTVDSPLARTPLHAAHVACGARMAPFAGWDMPIQYTSVIGEHLAVRNSAGIFDVSHMGQLRLEGSDAEQALDRVLSNSLARIPDHGMAQYTLLTNDHGGIEDDLIVYRMHDNSFLLVVNAANVEHDLAWITARLESRYDVQVRDESNEWSMMALQGPEALTVLSDVLSISMHDVPPFRHAWHSTGHDELLVCTTGYTGESGCEILMDPAVAEQIWNLLSRDERVTQCGLAARDTLRLEACYPLHGHDITSSTSAIGAGLGWACPAGRTFPGADLLDAERDHGSPRRLVPLLLGDRGIPRAGCEVTSADGVVVGNVTSGTMSPTLRRGIALAWLSASHAHEGTHVHIDVRGNAYDARVVSRPFTRFS